YRGGRIRSPNIRGGRDVELQIVVSLFRNSSSDLWQAANRPGVTSLRAGASVRHLSCACGHLGLSRQAVDGSMELPISPLSWTSTVESGSGRGMAARRARV